MAKIAVLMHLLIATILAGVLVLVVLATPSLADNAFKLIPAAFVVGVLAAIPPAIWSAKAILKQTNGQ